MYENHTMLHRLAKNSSTIEGFVSEVKRLADWVLVAEQKKYTTKDLREFWLKVKGDNLYGKF